MANQTGDAMGMRKQARITGLSWLGPWPGLLGSLLLAGCASSAGSDGGSGGERLVCAKCSTLGGETSDFGTSTAAPTACELSESSAPIDEASARALGFGDALDLYTQSLTTPLAWTVNDVSSSGGQPAQGYSAATSITIQTSIANLTHRVPSLAGCADHLRVGLHVSVSTADGAITVAGVINANATRAATSYAFGRLDLSAAQGSLQLSPPPWPSFAGYLPVLLNFAPQSLRGAIGVEVVPTGQESSDSGPRYTPLGGRFPIDECQVGERAVTALDTSVIPGGKSVLVFNDELNAILQADHVAQWKSGGQTEVHATLGVPTSLCQETHSGKLRYVAVPLDIVSADGRIDLHGTADGSAQFDASGAPSDVWFERDGTVAAPALSASVGIADVDLGTYPNAHWSAEVRPFSSATAAPGGAISVEGVQADGRLADESGNTVGPLETLTWP
jgi:hypothetical protein